MAAQEIQTPTLVCLHAGIQLICVLCGTYMYEYILHVYRYINIFIFYLMFSSPCVFFFDDDLYIPLPCETNALPLAPLL